MRIAPLQVMLLLLASALLPRVAGAGCRLLNKANLPVTMVGLRPMLSAKINGADARFIVDSGAFFSMIPHESANAYKLKLHRGPEALRVKGIGGRAEVLVAKVEEFGFAGGTLHDVEFLVGGSALDSGATGLLGQNVLGGSDVEYDLASGVVRLMDAQGDCDKAPLAYWAGSTPFSVIDLDWTRSRRQHTTATALVNGVEVKVMFDTGATSMLSLAAAKRAGIYPESPGVVAAGYTHGIGRRTVRTWIAPVASFRIGGEKITNTRLRIADADIDIDDADMLIGVDFFLSHHIFVVNSQDKLYFTYIGGPVFNLNQLAASPKEADPAGPTPEEDAAAKPADAASYARRGAAYAARRDFDHAIADLTHALELDPAEPYYLYQRAMARSYGGMTALALVDLDEYLKRKPEDIGALLARARANTALHDFAPAQADLAAADRLAAQDASIRLEIASAYLRIGALAPAIAQYDAWIGSHDADGSLASALNGRCWARALLGKDLDKAREDCDGAIHASPESAPFRYSRGLVLLRLGRYEESGADLDAALKANPENAFALYARGLVKLRQGNVAQGQTDLATAVQRDPATAEQARKYGLAP